MQGALQGPHVYGVRGAPAGQCDPNSLAVGGNLGFVGPNMRSVVDTNEIFQANGLPFSAPGGYITVSQNVWAFVYKDNAGNYWIQIDPAFQWTASFSAAVNAWASSFGISLNAPTGTSPQGPMVNPPVPGTGQRMAKCFAKGNGPWA